MPVIVSAATMILMRKLKIAFLLSNFIFFISYVCKWYSKKNTFSLTEIACYSPLVFFISLTILASINLGNPIILMPSGGSTEAIIISGT